MRPSLALLHFRRWARWSGIATLATLAGDDSFRIDKQLDQIGKNMKTVSVPNLNLKPETVDAAVRIGKAISDVVLGAVQEAAVRRFLKDTGPAADKLFSGMVDVLGDMRATNAQEKANVVGFLDIEVRQQRSHGQWLIAALAADREHVLSAKYQKWMNSTHRPLGVCRRSSRDTGPS